MSGPVDKATHVVAWRVTEAEKSALTEVASLEGITVSQVIRHRVFGHRIQYEPAILLPPRVGAVTKPVLREHNAPIRKAQP